jgi:tetratricopeptide (TPR) repeat protein
MDQITGRIAMKNAAAICVVLIVLSAMSGCITTKQGYVSKGNKQYDAGKYEDAALNYRKATQRDPKYGEAYYHLGLASIKLNRAPDAYNSLLRAVELLPSDVAAKEKFAEVCLAIYLADSSRPNSLYRQLTKTSDDILASKPNSYEGLVVRGYLAASDRKPAQAIDYFHKALQINNSDPGVTTELVRLLMDSGQTQESLKTATSVIGRNKDYGAIYDLLYTYYSSNGQEAEAEGILKSKVANNPKQGDFAIQLARHYYRNHKNPEMTATLQHLLDDRSNFPQARLWVGDFYLGARNYEDALKNYQEGASASKDANDRATYQKREVVTLRALGKKTEAFALAGRITHDNPKDKEALHLHADLALEIGKSGGASDAIREFEALASENPHDPSMQVQLGRAYKLKGDWSSARSHFQAALNMRNDLLEPRLELAELDLIQLEFAQAGELIDQVLKNQPANARARLLHARTLTATGKWKDSRAELTRLLKDNPQFVDAELELGVLGILEHHYPEAIETLSKFRETDPRACAGLATAYLGQGQPRKSEEVIDAALKKWPDSQLLVEQSAAIEAQIGNYDRAISQLRVALERDPKSSHTMRELGDLYEAKGDHATAITFYQQAWDSQPTDVGLALTLADALARAGRSDDAKKHYEGLLKVHPDNPAALNNLAFLLADSGGDLDEALNLAQRALGKVPNQPAFSDTVGYIYLKKGRTDLAMQTFGSLVRKNPELAAFHYHLGLAMFQKGDKAGARKELQSALKMSTLTPQDKTRVSELLAKIG